MNWKQALFITVCMCIAIVVPWFSVGMFFMGLGIGGFLVAILA